MRWTRMAAIFICALLTPLALDAAVPQTLHYSGQIDTGGGSFTGSVDVTFSLYDTSAAAKSFWSDTQAVAVSGGRFHVQLGPLSAADLDVVALHLGVKVSTDAEMNKVAIASVPYALLADQTASVASEMASTVPRWDGQKLVDSTLTVDSDGSLVAAGALGKGDVGSLGGGVRMAWYPSMGAFRAGGLKIDKSEEDTWWDDANVGQYSVAMGVNTKASALGSIALGYAAVASGIVSTALGQETTASGFGSTAMGSNIEVGSSGQHSFGIGLNDNISWKITLPNVMAVMGGNVGIGTVSPGVKLEVHGTIKADSIKFADGTEQTTAASGGTSGGASESVSAVMYVYKGQACPSKWTKHSIGVGIFGGPPVDACLSPADSQCSVMNLYKGQSCPLGWSKQSIGVGIFGSSDVDACYRCS